MALFRFYFNVSTSYTILYIAAITFTIVIAAEINLPANKIQHYYSTKYILTACLHEQTCEIAHSEIEAVHL